MKCWKFEVLQDWFESFSLTLNFWSWSNWIVAQLINLFLIWSYTWSWSISWERIFFSDLIRIGFCTWFESIPIFKIRFNSVLFNSNQTFNMIWIKLFFLKKLVSSGLFDLNHILFLIRIRKHLIQIVFSLIRINWHIFQILGILSFHLIFLIWFNLYFSWFGSNYLFSTILCGSS